MKLQVSLTAQVQDENNNIKSELKKLNRALDESRSRLESSTEAQKGLERALQEKETEMNDLTDYFEAKKLELLRVQDDLEAQSDKRLRMENLFQDVSEREMRIQKDLQALVEDNERLKVLLTKSIRHKLGFGKPTMVAQDFKWSSCTFTLIDIHAQGSSLDDQRERGIAAAY